jgi:hypothetical protein
LVRADFDRNIYVNTDEIPDDLYKKFLTHSKTTVDTQLDNKYSLRGTTKQTTESKQLLLAEMFYRCPGEVKMKDGAKRQCGKACHASSDWRRYTREGRKKAKNAWTCDCT